MTEPTQRTRIDSPSASQQSNASKPITVASPVVVGPSENEVEEHMKRIVELEKQNERLLSLVRLQRAELHEQNAITDKEYADLVQQSNLRVLLETHDDLREQLKTQADEIGRLQATSSHNEEMLSRLLDGALIPHDVAGGELLNTAQRLELLIGKLSSMRDALDMVKSKWTFNNNQHHTHTWHDWADCVAVIEQAISASPPAVVPDSFRSEAETVLQSLLADIGGFDANLLNTPMESKGEFATRELAAIWAKHGHLYKEAKTPYATCGTCGVEVFPGVRHDCKPVAVPCHTCGSPTTRSSGVCNACINAITNPSPVPDNPSDIDPEKTREDGDAALREHVAAQRARMTRPAAAQPVTAPEQQYRCQRCGITWDGPIQECPKCEQTDKVSVQTEEKPATVPLAVAEGLAEALSDLKQHAVVLSKDYLSTFTEWGPDATIQGWPKRRWVAALVAYGKAEKALATFQASTKE